MLWKGIFVQEGISDFPWQQVALWFKSGHVCAALLWRSHDVSYRWRWRHLRVSFTRSDWKTLSASFMRHWSLHRVQWWRFKEWIFYEETQSSDVVCWPPFAAPCASKTFLWCFGRMTWRNFSLWWLCLVSSWSGSFATVMVSLFVTNLFYRIGFVCHGKCDSVIIKRCGWRCIILGVSDSCCDVSLRELHANSRLSETFAWRAILKVVCEIGV